MKGIENGKNVLKLNFHNNFGRIDYFLFLIFLIISSLKTPK